MPEAPEAPARQRTVVRDSILSMIALVVVGVTRVLYGSMVSHATDPETYGKVGVLIAVTLILSLILPAGINSAIARYVPFSIGQGDLQAARFTYRSLWRIGILASLALGILAGAGAAQLGLDTPVIIQLSLLTIAYSLYIIYKAGLYGFNRVQTYLRLEILASACILGSTVVVLLLGGSWLLAPQIAGYAAFSVVAHQIVRPTVDRSVSAVLIDRGDLARYVALACIGTLASAGFLQVTQILAAGYSSLHDAAYFTATITMLSSLYFLPRALGLALFPSMAEAHGAGEVDVVRDHADRSTRALLCLLAPAFAVAVILAGEALVIYGGSQFYPGALIMQIVLLASFVSVIQVPSVNALSSASGRGLRRSAGWAVAGAVCGLAVIPVLGTQMGATGIAVAYLVGTTVTASGPIAAVWRLYGMGWTGPALRALGSLVLVFLVARLLQFEIPVPGVPWVRDAVAAVIVLAATLIVLRDDLLWAWGTARRFRKAPPDGRDQAPRGPTVIAGPRTGIGPRR